MRSIQVAATPLMWMLLCITLTTCEIYYVAPLCSSDQGVCFTLADFDVISTNTTLMFLQGNHTLDSELLVINSRKFAMLSAVMDTWISCERTGFLNFINISYVEIRNLRFHGCGHTTLREMTFMNICNSIFIGKDDSGTALVIMNSVANVTNSIFVLNTGTVWFPVDEFILRGNNYKRVGGAIAAYHGIITITDCKFHGNSAEIGGVLYVEETTVHISNSHFQNNFANPRATHNNRTYETGGVMVAFLNCLVLVNNSTFHNNSGMMAYQGVFLIMVGAIVINNCIFLDSKGSVVVAFVSNVTDTNSVYSHNNSTDGSVLYARRSHVMYLGCNFTENSALLRGGVVQAEESVLIFKVCHFSSNEAIFGGGVAIIDFCTLICEESTFSNHNAVTGGALHVDDSHIWLSKVIMYNNSAQQRGSAMYLHGGLVYFTSLTITNHPATTLNKGVLYAVSCIINSMQQLLVSENSDMDASIFYLDRCICNFTGRFTFSNNLGSLVAINCRSIFHGVTKFLNCSHSYGNLPVLKGGAITCIEGTIYFIGKTLIDGNRAYKDGGAIHAIGSMVHMIGETNVTNNTGGYSGGGVYLFQSKLNCVLICTFSGNTASNSGGGIFAIASTLYANDQQVGTGPGKSTLKLTTYSEVMMPTTIAFIGNEAQKGGAISLQMNSKLYGTSSFTITFEYNLADHGGAVYVDDYTNSGTCASTSYSTYSASTECFIQTLTSNNGNRMYIDDYHYQFLGNYATKSGMSLYGGLLDRCTVSPITDLMFTYLDSNDNSSLVNKFFQLHTQLVENNNTFSEDLSSISSDPVRICFCKDAHPECSYQWPLVTVKKGYPFTITMVAVDQVNHTVNATIRSFLSSRGGGLGEGQQSQDAYELCTNLTFSAFSQLETEKLILYAEGPCNNTGISKRSVIINFSPCSCPIGFQPTEAGNMKCDCNCDPQLFPYITNCNSTTKLLTRQDIFWIGYHSELNHSGYLFYRYCPYDYCYPSTPTVKVNLNNNNGSDAQCALNRNGLLCGACKPRFSLSLGSSRCIRCSKGWPGVLFALLLTAIVAGIVLIVSIQMLNLTVATGTLNGTVFYVNIFAANFSTFLPVAHPNIATVFVAWLNLDLGIDVCLYPGMDAYTKQWLQLIFPAYVIVLVAFVIVISERSSRFARLVGRGNPVATLATLILLSYAKLLRAVIDIFSFAVLKYPDGSNKMVWLSDATIPYLGGKHILPFLAAVIILALGVLYTLILFFWQWLQQLPRKWFTQLIWNTRLNSFMDAYLAPYTPKHRYWTGLLLFARVILYLMSVLNVSNNPRITLLAVNLIISCFFVVKTIFLVRVYRKLPIELLECSFYLNILLLSLASFYSLGNQRSQVVAAYTSIGIAMALFFVTIFYHVFYVSCKARCVQTLKNIVVKGRKRQHDACVNLLTNDIDTLPTTQCHPTSTVVEILSDPENQHSTEYSKCFETEMEATKMTDSSDINSGLLTVQKVDQPT